MIAAVVLAQVVGGPCSLLAPREIGRILGWSVRAGTARSYRLAGGAGSMCAFVGPSGSVIVTMPRTGTGVTINDQTSDLGTSRTPLHTVRGTRLPTELGRDSAIVHAHGVDYAIMVEPIDAQFTDDTQMRALADALTAHLVPAPHAHRG